MMGHPREGNARRKELPIGGERGPRKPTGGEEPLAGFMVVPLDVASFTCFLVEAIGKSWDMMFYLKPKDVSRPGGETGARFPTALLLHVPCSQCST